MLRVVADTNIYISALNFGGLPERLLRVAEAGGLQLLVSDAILDEVCRVLHGKKFAWPEGESAAALQQLARISVRVHPVRTLSIIAADPSDDRILECAEAGAADVIVSGDNHLLRLRRYGGIRILRVAEFFEQWRQEARQPL